VVITITNQTKEEIMFKFQRIIMSIVVAAVVVVFCVSNAGAFLAKTQDLNSFSCKDIMRESGGDRDISIGIIHGYLLGKKGTSTYKSEKLGEATDEFIETCLDNPKAMAIKTMEDILNKAK